MKEKIRFSEKMAYGVTDFASGLIWTTVSAYLMYYYTDISGLAVGAVGTMFLVIRVLDALVDPAIGVLIDKTNTRWGKCRPYFLWMSLPLAIMMILTFSIPNLSPNGKLIYAYITYGILGIIYSACNLPVTAILPRLAQESNNRTVLGIYRMICATISSLAISMITLPLVNSLAHTSSNADIAAMNDKEYAAYVNAQAHGFQITIIIYSVLALILFLYAFIRLREKVSVSTGAQGQSFKVSVKAIKGNLPWLIVMIVGLLLQISLSTRQAASLYYMKYIIKRMDLIPVMGIMGILIFIPLIATPLLVSKIGKRNTVIFGNTVALVGNIIIWLLGAHSIPFLFVGNILTSIGLGFGLSLTFVMISDTVDYGEWKSGVRAEGLLSAGASFGQKVGTGVGGALAGWVLYLGGYNGEATVQSASGLHAISFNYNIVPIVSTIALIVLMYFYKLDKEMPKMMEDLKEKHSTESKN